MITFIKATGCRRAEVLRLRKEDIREKRDSSVLACYEYEYVDAAGIDCMDIFIAIE